MQTISINFIVPQGWHELSDKQLRYVFQLIASEYATDEIADCSSKRSGWSSAASTLTPEYRSTRLTDIFFSGTAGAYFMIAKEYFASVMNIRDFFADNFGKQMAETISKALTRDLSRQFTQLSFYKSLMLRGYNLCDEIITKKLSKNLVYNINRFNFAS